MPPAKKKRKKKRKAMTRAATSRQSLEAYGHYTKSVYGALVNIALILNPINLGLEFGLGKGFLPTYGNTIFANGLASLLSVFVVFAIFTGRRGILGLCSGRGPMVRTLTPFWTLFLVTFGLGLLLLIGYVWIKPLDETGAFLYAGAWVGFTAAFHLLAVRNFMERTTQGLFDPNTAFLLGEWISRWTADGRERKETIVIKRIEGRRVCGIVRSEEYEGKPCLLEGFMTGNHLFLLWMPAPETEAQGVEDGGCYILEKSPDGRTFKGKAHGFYYDTGMVKIYDHVLTRT